MMADSSPAQPRRRFVLIDDPNALRELLKQMLLCKFASCEVEDFEMGRADLEAVRLVARGFRSKEVDGQLSLSTRTEEKTSGAHLRRPALLECRRRPLSLL